MTLHSLLDALLSLFKGKHAEVNVHRKRPRVGPAMATICAQQHWHEVYSVQLCKCTAMQTWLDWILYSMRCINNYCCHSQKMMDALCNITAHSDCSKLCLVKLYADLIRGDMPLGRHLYAQLLRCLTSWNLGASLLLCFLVKNIYWVTADHITIVSSRNLLPVWWHKCWQQKAFSI